MRRYILLLAVWALIPITIGAAQSSPTAIDIAKSTITVKVFKSGLFSAFAHDHEISAPIKTGSFRLDGPSVELTVSARDLRVVDKEVSDKDRAEIQETMLGSKVLDSQQFPEIRFESTQVDRLRDNQWTVQGNLTLHGQTRTVKVHVEGVQEHYRGSAELKQRDFGIVPVTVAGGAVKVKDEVRIEFDIVGK